MENENFLKENKRLIVMAIFFVVLTSFFIYISNLEKQKTLLKNKNLIDYQAVLNNIVLAKSFYVYDILDDKPIFLKDEHAKLPLASITKLMTGVIASDTMPDTTIITINKEDVSVEGDSGLAVGEKWKLKDLLNFSLIMSSNDGMHAISRSIDYLQAVNNLDTVKMMNKKAEDFGMSDTFFINETGLDINKNMSGSYSSAYDISILLTKIMKDYQNMISDTNKKAELFVSENNIKHTAINTNASINEIAGLLASKTGFTDLAGGNLAIVFDAGFMHPVVVVVLGSTEEGRFSDAVLLAKFTLEKLSE